MSEKYYKNGCWRLLFQLQKTLSIYVEIDRYTHTHTHTHTHKRRHNTCMYLYIWTYMPVKCIPFIGFVCCLCGQQRENCISQVPKSVAVQSHAPEIGGVGDGGGGGVMGLVFGLVCGMYLWAAFSPWNLQLSMEQQLHLETQQFFVFWTLHGFSFCLLPLQPASLSNYLTTWWCCCGWIVAKLLQHAKLVWVMTVIAIHLCWGPDPELYTSS